MGPAPSWPEPAAAAETGPPGGTTTDPHARLTNDGAYSTRNPANPFALPPARLAGWPPRWPPDPLAPSRGGSLR
ncbi:hypothetical protein [Streptomyces sp. NPDC048636]|uniref:hypothetical protein n=1 Tax=Streptomyces sp. NPDC048636 TaxID=3155762 RepID=UPI003422BF54